MMLLVSSCTSIIEAACNTASTTRCQILLLTCNYASNYEQNATCPALEAQLLLCSTDEAGKEHRNEGINGQDDLCQRRRYPALCQYLGQLAQAPGPHCWPQHDLQQAWQRLLRVTGLQVSRPETRSQGLR